ncbi:translation factor SUA5 [Rhodothalassium salexigens DSM 2132]|uniref:Threonylcarbamoyl-AMP synthase n=1 Tax=Rhodothalassium salexigens DSM 2132 TaxID=1188247 RepID=A0A4V2SND5_RHOSA|nr:L-threonylcarbamoyladenylate synthase [Rhodothalassium salexigens]MBB4212586.1 L-threonylcarbamoyladenylate synthase [Rhodothalassium salexigens DSM 2132]MBK1639655.1 threonylcarbamoyl-AMP synthase [Rhodothalassium salexigens DSM 2132]TCP30816.1 translation factor SUA5 [Rhodothalassium salexigens DSM 2132]
MPAPIEKPRPKTIDRAVETLRQGGLVALPTETVYGLAVDASQPRAVAHVFEVKGRPQFNPLICHVAGRDMAGRLVTLSPAADALIAAFWPGPLTLVLPRRADAPVADLVSAGLDTLAVRAPAHSVMRQVLFALDRPVAAPSANPSGRLSPTRADHVADGLGDRVDLIVDGGPCAVGLESTVVEVRDDAVVVLRHGSITTADLRAVVALPVREREDGDPINAPGQLLSHYAPRAALRLDATEVADDEILIGFGAVAGDLNLSPAGDLEEAATRLFALLREADARADRIAVAPVPDHGLGRAINDRLRRAAAPRPH